MANVPGSFHPSQPPTARPSAAPSGAAEAATQVAVVATHTDLRKSAVPLPFVLDPDSELAASFRILRHRLRRAGDPKTIAVSSPNPREGKTTCAANLAMALAEHGRDKVMLLEANLRRPRIAEVLGFSPPACFGEQMVSHLKSPNAPWKAVACFFDNLHVLAVAPIVKSKRLLSAPGLKLAINQLRASGYSYIVIDCPSILRSADVNVIEDCADGVLLTGMAGSTTAKSLRDAVRHLAPTEIVGAVLMSATR